MTQALVNTLNNLEQFTQVDKTVAKKTDNAELSKSSEVGSKLGNKETAKTEPIGMGKKTNFESVLDSKIVDKKASIDDVKHEKTELDGSDTKNLADFKAILTEVTKDSNVESALDLTLAKDIGVIISQLKEAVEDTVQSIEENSEDLNFDIEINVDSLVTEESDENFAMDILTQDLVTLEEDSKNADVKVPFEQVLTFVDESVVVNKDVQIVEQVLENDALSLAETFKNTQSEIVEFAENVTNEVVKTDSTIKTDSNNMELNIDEEILKELKIETLSVESDTSDGETLMQNQTAEEHSVKIMINQDVEVFDLKLEALSNQQANSSVQSKPVEVNPSKLIDQISKHIENLHSGSKVNIVLNPESLGKVSIQLMSTKDGLTAQFTVTTQEAKDLLMKGLDGLKETLTSQGVGVDNVSVKVADSQKSEYSQDWTEQDGSRGGNKEQKNQNREEKEKGLFEKMMAQTTEQDENGKV